MSTSSHILTQARGDDRIMEQTNNPGDASRRGLPKEEVGWRRIVRNFTSSWFSVNMGTGIVSILIHGLPYTTNWLSYVSYIFFALNVVLFVTFLVLTTLRYSLYPEIWFAMIRHPAQSLFLGCIPMALATIINMIVLSCKSWGTWTIYLAWALWWLDVTLSLATCLIMPFVVMRHHNPQLQQTNATLLLPVVPAVVAAASGGIVAEALPSIDHAVATLIVSYLLWGLGGSFSLLILAMYFQRLNLHSVPPKEAIVSMFLPVGPLGQGGFGIQQLGKVALKVLPKSQVLGPLAQDSFRGVEILYVLGVFAALIMWGFAVGWLAFAIISIATTPRFPFNMGWWGFTFPLGVFTTCTSSLGENLSSPAFKILTMIFSCSVFALWLLVAVRTLRLALTGEMFFAPCLGDIRPKTSQADGDRTA
ncbi:voltage-dependent anion channel [Whalleya microplaca]|nr:voltage-dependent anion channel [Whalleya microplaca]